MTKYVYTVEVANGEAKTTIENLTPDEEQTGPAFLKDLREIGKELKRVGEGTIMVAHALKP